MAVPRLKRMRFEWRIRLLHLRHSSSRRIREAHSTAVLEDHHAAKRRVGLPGLREVGEVARWRDGCGHGRVFDLNEVERK